MFIFGNKNKIILKHLEFKVTTQCLLGSVYSLAQCFDVAKI